MAQGDELGRALRQAVEAPPLDPDYRTPVARRGTRVDDGDIALRRAELVVDLSAPSDGQPARPAGRA